MIRLNLVFSLLVLSPFIFQACSDTKEQVVISSKEELLKSIQAFNHAFQIGNVDKLSNMITDNYQHTNGTAKAISKAQWLSYLHKRKQRIEAGELKIKNYEMEDTVIELFGSTALLTAKISVTTEQNGTLLENEYRVTNLWVYQEGTWKRAGFHDGKIK